MNFRIIVDTDADPLYVESESESDSASLYYPACLSVPKGWTGGLFLRRILPSTITRKRSEALAAYITPD
ncbi:hypothetical protein [uncultured Desulfobacter sp.]|uniref:hypothetical protein n=1 Tax=uncultured Desulfobacter sp. TaxID=240139 RepID=UPI00259B896E|nr:hypothetical protein [uncultured Desulfobacter sp.]